jgi:glycosyltransferase involved in cell wall biosynthesis
VAAKWRTGRNDAIIVSGGSRELAISVVIPALNEGTRIAEAVRSVSWAREVLVADGGSSDDTVAQATALGATVLERTGPTVGAQRNAAIERASCDWILALDADERATPALRDELAVVVTQPSFDAYRVQRRNTYLGQVMRHGRLARDSHFCFFRRSFRYDDARVHERLVHVERAGRLRGPIDHTPYRDLAHHSAKLIQYAQWAAEDRFARGQRASGVAIVAQPPLRFLRDYLAYGGWRDGWRGAVAAAMSAHSVFLRLALLREMEKDA